MSLVSDPSLLIGGVLRGATGGRIFDNVNPFTEASLGHAPDAGPEDVDAALSAARRAFDDNRAWRSDPAWRATCLRQLAAALERHAEAFRAVILAEVGCPSSLTDAVQVGAPIAELAEWADRAEVYAYETALPSTPRRRQRPAGAVGAAGGGRGHHAL